MRQHTKPCRGCPFQKASLPGWLGGRDPVAFAQLAQSEARMPCHTLGPRDRVRAGIDYADAQEIGSPEWSRPQCAGRAIMWANQIKIPRNPDLLILPKDPDRVFTRPDEFIEHHCKSLMEMAP